MVEWKHLHTISHKELRDALRSRWFWLYAVVFSGLALALSWFGLVGIGSYGLSGFGRTAASLINIILLITPLMGLTLGTFSLTSERERGTLLFLLAQPVVPTEILLGKYLGLAAALCAALLGGFGLSGLVIAWWGGNVDAGSYLLLVILACLLTLSALSLGFLLAVIARKGVSALGIALFLWLALVFLGDLGLLGTALTLQLKVGELFALALINPLQLFKLAAVLNLRTSLEVLGPVGLYATRTYGSALLPMLAGLLTAWVVLPLGVALYLFQKRGAF